MKTKRILSILIILIIALLGFAIFDKFYKKDVKTDRNQLSEKQIKALVVKVSKLINTPEETPVIATIIKADQLIAEQKFYTGSKDGDYLMVFPTAQKAIIYREKENRLINVGPIIVDQPKATTTPVVQEETSSTTTIKETKKTN